MDYTYKKQLVFDMFEEWKPIYFGIPLFRKWNPKIDWKSIQVTIKNQLFKIKRKLIGTKNDNFKIFTRKYQTNCEGFATLEFILSKNTTTYSENLKKQIIAKTF